MNETTYWKLSEGRFYILFAAGLIALVATLLLPDLDRLRYSPPETPVFEVETTTTNSTKPPETTQKPPETIETTTTQPSTTTTNPPQTHTTTGTSVWTLLAECETGQNWTERSVPGYSGGLGFAHSTWAAMGGTQYAYQAWAATPAQQIEIAQKVLKVNGNYSAWPGCRKKLGLP